MKYVFILILSIQICFGQLPLTNETSTNFSGSGNCATCHISNGSVLTWNGNDVSPVTHWRSAMMANSAKRPLWRAVVAAEVLSFPHLQATIESRCTNCHAPMGYSQAVINGQSGYSIAEMDTSELAKDGVSCTLCHQIQDSNFGHSTSFGGGFDIGLNRIINGPYQAPFTSPMYNMTSYIPAYAAYINDSELCATCHTLYTPYIDNNGNVAGTFPEQVPYLEWKNSDFPAQGTECQTCHMPQINDPMDISTLPPWHTATHSPYWQHHFVGGNVFMQQILRDNIDTLGLSATVSNFDSTRQRTLNQLRSNTVNLSMNTMIQSDTLVVGLEIENLTGHKIPTGIPLRRMWIHLIVSDQSGHTIFESGEWDADGEIINIDDEYEPHYDLITQQHQVQIYQGVMQDVDDSVTYRLLRAAAFAKDNRIPPKGFMTSHSSYDSTRIVGAAETDANFNILNGTEGSGKDYITYKIPFSQQPELTVQAELCFQTISPHFLIHLFELSSPEIDLFENIYYQQDNSPIILSTISEQVMINTIKSDETGQSTKYSLLQNYPNPFNNRTKISFTLPDRQNVSVKLYNAQGKIVKSFDDTYSQGSHSIYWDGTDKSENLVSSGVYYYEVVTGDYSEVKKCLLIK